MSPLWRNGAILGVVAVGGGLAVSEVASGILHQRVSPVVAVAESIIRLTPGSVIEAVISVVGHHDKTVLIASTLVITLLFAAIFRFLPDVRLSWRDVLLGAAITAVLFTAGRYLIALYLGRSTVASIYGAAGSLVALLVWVYYSCAILFFGVEFIRAYRQARRLKVEPKETAVQVREEFVTPRAHNRD